MIKVRWVVQAPHSLYTTIVPDEDFEDDMDEKARSEVIKSAVQSDFNDLISWEIIRIN